MNRREHLQWCKNRALEYLEPGQYYSPQEAVASMISDLGKHEETASSQLLGGQLGMMELMNPTEDGIRRFIEGFN